MEFEFNIKPDVANLNGVVYPKDVLEKAFDEYSKKPQRLGALKYGSGSDIPLSDIAFEVKSISKIGDKYVGDIEILNVPAGEEIRKMLGDMSADEFRICTMMICDTDLVPKSMPSQNILRVTNASIEYVILYPKKECA